MVATTRQGEAGDTQGVGTILRPTEKCKRNGESQVRWEPTENCSAQKGTGNRDTSLSGGTSGRAGTTGGRMVDLEEGDEKNLHLIKSPFSAKSEARSSAET